MKRLVCGAIVLCVIWPSATTAELRRTYEDVTVVERADLIVVATILPESIDKVFHQPMPRVSGVSWEHHATLVVSEVLKGSLDGEQSVLETPRELPIVFDYGLGPSIGRAPWKTGDGRDPAEVVEISDYGNSVASFTPLIADAREDALWLLRRKTGSKKQHSSGRGRFRVRDPEDVWSSAGRGVIVAYLSEDPEGQIRQGIAAGDPRPSSKRFLAHREIERIRQIDDLEVRFERLLPFFLDLARWNISWTAQDAMAECGAVCAEGLEGTFRDLEPGRVRNQIMEIWGELQHRAAVPLLIEALEEGVRYFVAEQAQDGGSNRDLTSEWRRKRSDAYGDIYRATYTLSKMPDPSARAILEKTRDQWRSFDNDQITRAAERALERLGP
ncbi:MAG: hypothetical protein AAFX50_13005 [Acidobacteriota bacterium]